MDLKGTVLSEKSQPQKITYYSIPMLFSKWQNYSTEEQISGGQGLGLWEVSDSKGETGSFSVVMEQFCILTVVVVTQKYTCELHTNTPSKSFK